MSEQKTPMTDQADNLIYWHVRSSGACGITFSDITRQVGLTTPEMQDFYLGRTLKMCREGTIRRMSNENKRTHFVLVE